MTTALEGGEGSAWRPVSFAKVNFNIVLLAIARSSNLFPSGFSTTTLCALLFSHTCHIPYRLSHSSRPVLTHENNFKQWNFYYFNTNQTLQSTKHPASALQRQCPVFIRTSEGFFNSAQLHYWISVILLHESVWPGKILIYKTITLKI